MRYARREGRVGRREAGREAGGQVTAYDGSPLDVMSGRLLATNGHIHSIMGQTLSQIKPLVLPPLEGAL